MRILWIILACGLMANTAAAAETARIVVSGQGEVAVSPDLAILSLGASHEAVTAESAMDEVSARITDVLQTLTSEGVDIRDVQTSRVQLQPVYGNDRQVRFRATNQLSVRLRDLSKLSRILGRTLSDGANELGGWSSGLRFEVSDPAPFRADARRLAVIEARAKAEELAEAAGVTLGPIVEIREGGGPAQPMMMERAALAQGAGVPIAEGEVVLRAEVQMVFAIVQ